MGIAFVTGIGMATAISLARAGHSVYAGMRNPRRHSELHEAIAREKLGIRIVAHGVDDNASKRDAVGQALAEAGRIDVRIRSARNTSRKKICEILRNCGNLECAKNFPYAPTGDCTSGRLRQRAIAPAGDCANGRLRQRAIAPTGKCVSERPSKLAVAPSARTATQESFACGVSEDSDRHHFEWIQAPFLGRYWREMRRELNTGAESSAEIALYSM